MSDSFNRPVQASAPRSRLLFFRIDGTSTRSILEGATDASLPSSGSTGVYVLTLNKAAKRTPIIVGIVPLTANLQPSVSIDSGNAAITISFTNNSGTATDTDFHLVVNAWESADAN